MFLERHAIVAKPRTITELRWRLKQSEAKFGTVPLVELEGMADEIAGWAVTIPERLRYPLMAAFRQALEAGVRYGYLTRNPAKLAGPNPMPPPREIRVYTPDEIKAIAEELGTVEAAAVRFAAATGLRPAEWASIERRDVDKARRVSTCGARRRSARGARCRSRAPRSTRSSRCRLGSTAATCSRRRGSAGLGEPGPFDVANFRRRVWGPAVDAAGIATPARLYDLRSTFASNALAAGITMFELARIMGT